MQKFLHWSGQRLLISNGTMCSILDPLEDYSRDFTTDGVSALSPDGALVAVCEHDGVARVRRVVPGQWRAGDVLFSCQGLPAKTTLAGFRWSRAGELLAVQVSDGAIHTYQIAPGRSRRPGQHLGVFRIDGPRVVAPAIAFSPSGTRIAQACTSGVVLWEARTGVMLRTVGRGQVRSIAWSPDGRYLALGGCDSTITVYLSARPQDPIRSWTGHTAEVTSLAWSPDGICIASGDQDGNVLYWSTCADASQWGLLPFEEVPMRTGVSALAWSADGEQVAVVDQLDQLDVFQRTMQKRRIPA